MSEETAKADDAVASDAAAPAAPETAPATSADPLDQLLAEWDQKYPTQPEVQPPSESASPADDNEYLATLEEAQRGLDLDFQQREQAWQTQLSHSQDQLRLLQAQAASSKVANEGQISQLSQTVQQLQQSLQQEEWRQPTE